MIELGLRKVKEACLISVMIIKYRVVYINQLIFKF